MAKVQLEHTALWQQFQEALTKGCKAQVKRSRLFCRQRACSHVQLFAVAFSCFRFRPLRRFPVLMIISSSFLSFSIACSPCGGV